VRLHGFAPHIIEFPLWRLFPAKMIPVLPLPLMLVAAISMIFLNACTTLELPEYHAKSFDHYPASLSKDGLSVAIHLLRGYTKAS